MSTLGLYQYIQFEIQWFKRTRIRLPIRDLATEFVGLKIVHLSDLHLGPWISHERFSEVIDMALEQHSDLILITGDFIDRETQRESIPIYVEQLKQLQAELGVYAVLGNHDHWQDADLVRRMLADSGIPDLSNRVATFQRGDSQFHVCGLDDHMVGEQDLETVLEVLPEQGCALLLVHEPDYADISAATGRFALQLSGHSHGGQVYVPFYGAPITPGLARKYPRGLYEVDGMALYTNTGIGMVRPYVRFNCRPEVAVFTLESLDQQL